MKIRNPKVQRAVSWLGAMLIRGWVGTVHYQDRSVGPRTLPNRRGRTPRRYLYAFWHEHMLLPACRYPIPDLHVLISTHSDGQLITDIVHRLGLKTIRGSTTRGGSEALRQFLRISRESHIVLTPDGPQGPRRVLQQGVVYLASRTGLPIVPVAFAHRRAWRAKSWDRFVLPLPFGRGFCVTTPPLFVPRSVTPETIEPYRLGVERAMHEADRLAESWAATGHFEPGAYRAPELLKAVA
jgi:lysophospholipid acyltransferase (LPLAT)-like uncharacterized protein